MVTAAMRDGLNEAEIWKKITAEILPPHSSARPPVPRGRQPALESEIAEALAHVQLELTSLTKAIGGQLGGALAEAWPGERREEDLPAFELVLRVRDRMAGRQFLGT